MRRLFAVLLGGLGLRALLRRRRPAAIGPSPADDLRARLAEARSMPAPRDEDAAAPGTPADEAPDVDARRADVHARTRRAIEDLKD